MLLIPLQIIKTGTNELPDLELQQVPLLLRISFSVLFPSSQQIEQYPSQPI